MRDQAQNLYYNKGNDFRSKRRWNDAIAAYRKAIELNPDDASAHNSLAWLLVTCPVLEHRDPQSAVDIARRAADLAPQKEMYWNTLGVSEYRSGDWQAAVKALTKAEEQ